MYYLTTEGAFDAAHFLKGYNGKCSNLHGHRWRVVVRIKSDSLIDNGQERDMIIDFGNIKKIVKEEVDYFDHSFIYEKDSLKESTLSALKEEDFLLREVDFRPTAERFAKYFYDKISSQNFDVAEVMVYETPNNCASYGM